jgi:soluble lytic murein transglycosylase
MYCFFISLALFATAVQASEKLTDFSCEQLIEKSADQKFVLSTLAGLRAHKKCPNFKYDWRNISGFEKKIYSEELLDIDPAAEKPTSEKTIDELRAQIKTEKNNVERFKLYKALRQKYKNAGLRDDAKRIANDMYNWTLKNWKSAKKDPVAISQYLEAGLSQARVLWNADQIKSAKDLIKKINSDLKNENLAESYFLSGKLAEDEKNSPEAIKNYDLSLKAVQKSGIPTGSGLDINKLSWTKSWLLYKTEKWPEAETALREFSESTVDLTEKTRADFFRSRALIKLNKPEEAKLVLKNIIQKDFYSYYALASHYQLNENLPAVSKTKSPSVFVFDLKLSFLDDSYRNIFDALIKYDELDIAEKAVIVFSKNNDQNVNLSLYLAKEGLRYLPLFSSFAKLSNDAKMDVMQKYPELVFPRPHESTVKKMSEKTELPKSLIYSIMKQESGFNIKTRSHADAYGLMQLIPRLAKSLAKKYEIPYKNAEDLYDPEINIPLGSFELRDQIKKQNGQLTFVAAAYNAGPGALSGWLKTRPANTDIFDFIESIPYDETRMYVKIIARNKLFYERFEKPDQSFPFPAEFVTESVSK